MRLLLQALTVSIALVPVFPASTGPSKGDSIATLSFRDEKGRTLTLDDSGVLYLVDFWAVGCKPCIAEMPELDRLAREYEASGRFQLVSVVWGDWPAKDLRRIARQAGTTLPLFSDPENWHDRLGVDAFPTKFLIRAGRVLVRARGGGAGSYDPWKVAIDGELNVAPAAATP